MPPAVEREFSEDPADDFEPMPERLAYRYRVISNVVGMPASAEAPAPSKNSARDTSDASRVLEASIASD